MSTLATNPRALHDFTLIAKYEGGLELLGHEVKPAKMGSVTLKGAFLTIERGELVLKNAYIAPYKNAGKLEGYDPRRGRKVLVHKREIANLRAKHEAERLTLVPVRLYTQRGLVKIEFALARGKRVHEKRDSIKKRELDREIRARLKD